MRSDNREVQNTLKNNIRASTALYFVIKTLSDTRTRIYMHVYKCIQE